MNRSSKKRFVHQRPNKENEMTNESYQVELGIIQLHSEREGVQKKTFTKWANSFLAKVKMEVDDIFVDLSDGRKLLKLLELISGEKLGKPNNGKMRVHKIENVNKCLAFLHTKVKLESIGAEDIVDGNKTLILGLLWTIILRFQIQDIEIQVEEETDKKHSAKEALMLWCQRKTNGYPHVKVTDFSQSWRNGMAFNALIHSYRPELIDYQSLDPKNSRQNLDSAFSVAKNYLGIEPLLDSEDVDTPKPDEKSILTYVSSYYHTFAKYNSEVISGKRIANIISQLMEIDRLQQNYELYTTNLINWIQMKIHQLNDREFPNDLGEIQNEFIKFKQYRTVEKPSKYKERVEIEVLLFKIQTKRKALGQTMYVPIEGKLVQDIHKNWLDLEKAEHKRDLALQNKMIKLKKINNLADDFYRKANIRKSYAKDMIDVLSDSNYGNNIVQVEATIKKHEAISADILTRGERINSLTLMVNELKNENYSHIDDIEQQFEEIKQLWDKLLSLLEMHRKNLQLASDFMRNKQEIEAIANELVDLNNRMNIDSNVTHLRAAEEYLQKHSLIEVQILSHSYNVNQLCIKANKYLNNEAVINSVLLKREIPNLKQSVDHLVNLDRTLHDDVKLKRKKLTRLVDYYRLVQDIEEEHAALAEKMNICDTVLPGKDLVGIISLQQKHNAFEAEVKSHGGRIKNIEVKAENFFKDNECPEKDLINKKLAELRIVWQQLLEVTDIRTKKLAIIIEAFQHHSDANEADSWLKEKMKLAKSDDYGTDEQSASSLLKRHGFLENEVLAYSKEIERLNAQTEKMINANVESLFLNGNHSSMLDDDKFDEKSKNGIEPLMQEVYEDVKIPQVYVLYDLKNNNCPIKKGEVLLLLERSTNDWWKVCRGDVNAPFYAPVNFLQEIEPKITKVKTIKPVQHSQTSRNLAAKAKKRNSRRRLSIASDADSIEQRKAFINHNYKTLVEQCKTRKKLLEDSVKMFKFSKECDSFECWLNEMEESINKCSILYKQQQNTINDLSKQFEKFITDLLANRARLNDIDQQSKEISSPMHQANVRKRREQIQKKWEHVNFLQKQLGKNIDGLTSVEKFDRHCNEITERINDKLDKIQQHSNLNKDLKTVNELKRIHDNLERELLLIEELLKKLNMISENVKSSYPLEKSHVDKRLYELNSQWDRLKKCYVEERHCLDQMTGLQIIKNSSNDIIAWLTSYAKPMLQYDPKDASYKNDKSLEMISKEHSDLLVDIRGKHKDIETLEKFSKELSKKVNSNELKIVNELTAKYEEIIQDWENKSSFIKQCQEVNAFRKDADRIETMINSDMTFLEYNDTGSNCHDILSLIKRHETFLNTLNAQDQRVHVFIDFGDKLIQKKHIESESIKDRQQKILERRKLLKDKAFNRSKILNDAKHYHEIKSDADEFLNWCNAKQKLIMEFIMLLEDKENSKNVNSANFKRKFKKHQTSIAEIRANKVQLEKILNNLNELNRNSHFIEPGKLNDIEKKIKNEWNSLNESIEKSDKLQLDVFRQVDEKNFIKSLQDRVNEIDNIINSNEYDGIDRRSCKKLLQDNKTLEQELNSLENNVDKKLNNVNGDNGDVNNDFKSLKSKIQLLKQPLDERKQRLMQLNEYHQFEYDANAELQWIKERITLISANDVPSNLTDAQNWIKKLEQNLKREVDGHEVYFERILNKADELIKTDHPSKNEIQSKADELKLNWNQLQKLMSERVEKWKAYLKFHQYLSDCLEIESWLNEKTNLLNTPIYSKDEMALIKLLQKQKSIDLEVDTYSGLIDELVRESAKISSLVENESEKNLLKTRAEDLNVRLKKLQKLASERNLNLIDLKQFHEYYHECDDFLEWLNKQKQALLNDDFGKDYEHCIILQSKFFDLKRLILANEERYHQCIENGKRCNRKDDTIYTDIVTDTWNTVIDAINQKEQKFIAAVKMHRFNRDVADAFDRINEKSTILNNDDYGRDRQSTQNLIRKHDIFENDLVALEAQLQILINDSAKLKAAYPGKYAKQIKGQLTSVLEDWERLKKNSEFRKQRLCDTYEFHQFVSIVRDQEQWALNLINEMKMNDNQSNPFSSVDKARNAKNLHERIKLEIDGNEEKFNIIVNEGNKLASNPFYSDIKSYTEKLLATRNRLYHTWESKNVLIDQSVDFCYFMRDAKQLEQLYQQFKNRLNAIEYEDDCVEKIIRNLKKFDEFVLLFASHEQKFNTLNECSQKLIEKNNYFSNEIKIIFNDLKENKLKLTQMIESKKYQLSNDLIYAQFKQDIAESDLWISEKHMQIDKERLLLQDKKIEDDIEIKLKKFQKLQALEAEIRANETRITDIQQKAKHLITKNYPNSIEIRSQQDELVNKWNDLRKLVQEIFKGFEEAKDIYEFNKNIGLIESWIREKELMIQFNETGEDYEHCEALLRKLDDVDTGLKVDENEILKINNLANKLVNECQNENQIDEKRISLNLKWQQLQQKISDYRNNLKNAKEIHLLNRDLDEVNERITEKHLLAAKECDAKNLPSVENVQRKHEALCDDVNAIDEHFKNINQLDNKHLVQKNPELMEKSIGKIKNIQENLRKLSQECNSKSNKLQFLKRTHKFFDLCKEYENWANNMLANKLSNNSSSVNALEAINEIQDHDYLKAELMAKKENNQNLKNFGYELLQEMNQDKETNKINIEKIEEYIQSNDNLRKKLDQAWEDKKNYLKQCEQLHKFNDLSKQCDSWIASKDAFLTNEDLGSNMLTVEELIKKHDSFVQSLAAQQRIVDFSKFAKELIDMEHFDSQNIQQKLNETLERRDRLLESARIRKQKLEDSRMFYNFLRNFTEIQRWFVEKLKVANDESYRDAINLLSKKQKHAAFEAEINSNKDRIEAVNAEGERLINNSHFRSDDIKELLSSIEKLSRSLNESTNLKRNLLNDAHQALQFFRLCEVILLWIKDTEMMLNDQDNGKDLTSVRNLLKKHQLLENDVHNHNENIENIKKQLAQFQQNNHFQLEEIEEKGKEVIKNFNNLQLPLNRRREILEEYRTFYQFKNDIDHEFFWIKEKENQLHQLDNANTVFDIQRFIKRHKMFESEINTREPQLNALVSKGHNLLKSECSNYDEIKRLTNELQNKIQYIKDAFSLKRLYLADLLESHQFYSDIVEAESWINEKMSFLMNEDNGRDEESISMLSKKLEVISNEADRFNSTTMAKLMSQSNQLMEKRHSESEVIKQKADALTEKFNQCTKSIENKKATLSKRNKYFLFEREADELILWIKDQQIIANSEDYGQDVEHVESLIQQFNTFVSYVGSNEERIVTIENEGKNIQNTEEKLREICQLWNKLKESIDHRREALNGALEVYRFYRSADETICWIREKESSTLLDEVNSNYDDVSSVKVKIHQLEGFERDLNAVKEQVEILYIEAKKLAELYSDIKDNIDERKTEVEIIWNNLNTKTVLHKKNLLQIEKIQSYFDDYQQLLTWINEMQALITADDKLLPDVLDAEQQVNRHKEYESEIKARNENVVNFIATGEKIIAQGHIMSKEIGERNERIKNLYDNLLEIWKKRLTLYEYNLDARQFVQDVEQMEKWIAANHNYIDDNNFGDSIVEVEDLLLKHEEFEKTIQAQVEKLNAIQRITMIEKYFDDLKREEANQRSVEMLRREKDRLLEEEQKRILYKRSDEESRYYENILDKSLAKPHPAKLPRRIASFSFSRKSSAKISPSNKNLPPISYEGFLERKNVLQQGKKANSRSWKTYYTLLSGQLLCFFKDKNAFYNNVAASPPFSILNSRCTVAQDYTKKKFVFSVELTDQSKYLFATSNDDKLREWINAITFRAHLPPSKQLMGIELYQPSASLNEEISTKNADSESSSSSRKSSLASIPDNLEVNNENNGENIPSERSTSASSNTSINNSKTKYNPSEAWKYGSLPNNMAPIKEQQTNNSNNNDANSAVPSMKSFDDISAAAREDKDNKSRKKRSFFKRMR